MGTSTARTDLTAWLSMLICLKMLKNNKEQSFSTLKNAFSPIYTGVSSYQ